VLSLLLPESVDLLVCWFVIFLLLLIEKCLYSLSLYVCGAESSRLVGDSSPAGRRREKEKETKKVKEVVNLDQVEEEKEEVQSNKTGRDEKDLESEEVSKRGDKGDDSGQESGKEDGSSEKGGEEKSETEGGADNESATAPIKLTKCRKCGQKFTSGTGPGISRGLDSFVCLHFGYFLFVYIYLGIVCFFVCLGDMAPY
tara:strand:- start:147 stop:743 length:597 start_codon:yes stop_codon:yes gene_type:complete